MEQQDIIKDLERVLRQKDHIALALVYGSTASGALHAGSDVDVAVSAGRPLSAEERLELSVDLSQTTSRDVDLLDIELAEGMILHEICSDNVVLKNEEPELYGRLIVRMLDHQTDMMPNIRHIWKKRREKLLS